MSDIQTNLKKFNINSKLVKRLIAFVVIIAVGATAVTVYLKKGNTKQTATVQQTSKVVKGNFSISITGTGTVASTNTAKVSPKVDGTITKVYFNEGDTVKQGDLLYEMDDSDQVVAVEKIKNNITTAQLSNQDNDNSISKLNISAPFAGIVTSLTPNVGDTISKGGIIATIVDQSKYKLSVPLKVQSLNGIYAGAPVLVHVQGIMQTVQGKISLVSSPVTTSDGMQVVTLDVEVVNTGTLSEGLLADVEVNTNSGSVFSTSTGKLSYIRTANVTSETGGTVSQIFINEGAAVSSGDPIMLLTSSDLQLTRQKNAVGMNDYNTQLDTAQKRLEDYKVYSTIDGTITTQSLHEGDAVKVATATTTISDVKNLECSIPIDELDIAKIAVGQKTTITADALTQTTKTPLVGAVKSIGLAGTTTSGVTTYPVVISIPYTDGMRPGMNITSEIYVQDKQNTLYVPLESIQKVGSKNYVIVKGGTGNGYDDLTKLIQENKSKNSASTSNSTKSTTTSGNKSTSTNSTNKTSSSSSSTNRSSSSSSSKTSTSKTTINYSQYYQNTTLKEVELGINNDSSIEILSGVSEGDILVLSPKTSSSSSSQNAAGGMGMGMMGAAAGGGGQGGPPQGGRD